ncbi:Canalicular multispecific organic anion transporter 2 [Coemansia sp. S16]|nr:Canalicular multispecific organic anion transporter 2 [Coemansia sp. S16]
MALAIYLASRQLSTGSTSNMLSFASIVTLAVASVVGGTSSNIIAMTHVAQCVKAALFTPESSSLFATMLSILLHAAVAYKISTPLAKKTIVGHIYGILHVDTFSIIKEFENGTGGESSSTYASDLEMLKDQGQNFYIDTTQRLFLVRAILRAFKREFALILTGMAACNFIIHYRRLLFARILETFVADYSGNSAQTFKLIGLWSTLALANQAQHYIVHSKRNLLIEKIRCMVVKKILEVYMAKGSNGLDSQVIVRTSSGSWKVKAGLRGLFSIATSLFSEVFSAYIIIVRLGWGSILPVVIAVVYVILKAKVDVYAMKLRNAANSALPPKFQQEYINICQHMKTIKLYAWESVFLHEIGLGKAKYVTPPLVWLAQFTMRALNSSLSEIAAALAIISQLRSDSSFSYVEMTIILSSMGSLITFTRTLGSISSHLNYIAETETVFKQIESAQQANYIIRKTAAKDTAVKMNNSEFSWGKDKFSIRSSALEIKQGEFVAIVGKVGCGKSSIVSALCGEMPLESGEACIFGSIGYVSQKPWIMNATFRDNILLGNAYDEERYNRTIEACALTEDLKLMPAGDMSEIGHAGINLSGGQKTRLALARAIYMEADVFIFDDLLSAVDAHVERHLVERVLAGNGLLANKTRILVTHAEHVVPLCDKVITIDHGDILVTPQKRLSYNDMAGQDSTPSADLEGACAKPAAPGTSKAKSGEFTISPELEVPAFNRQTLWKFIAFSGYFNVATAIALQFLFSYGFYYVEGLRMELVKDSGSELMVSALKRYLIINAVVTIMKSQISSLSMLIYSHIWSDQVGLKMTNLIVEALMFAPLPVFERMSKGTLEGLMYKDVLLVSNHLPSSLCHRVYEMFNAINSLILTIRTSPIVLLYLIPLLFVMLLVNKRREKVQEIILSVMRGSGVRLRENIFQEVLAGKEVMRTHDRVDHYIDKFTEASAQAAILENQSTRITAIKASIEEIVVDILYICILVYCKLASLNDPTSSFGPGNMDMMMRFSGSTLKKLSSLSFSDIGITQSLPSLSRLFVYAEKLGREPPHVIEDTQPSADWPAQGAIEFKDYSMSYRSELGTVLNQLSFTINSKEKVGIVGRTGAGKSSLTYALLRLVEPATGSIFIDGIDISTIGLHTLRSNISVVPQDPVLFEGTIRDNLDPKREYTDAQVWEAIEKAKVGHLLTAPTGTFDSSAQPNGHSLVRNPLGKWVSGTGLDKWVSPNGTNFSVGERQLLSLCRALLWQRPILIMDEATANIDSATDQVIQAVIREEFNDKTVLTIAHRLNTVMSCDRILVLDAGKVQEFDSPSELLSRDGHFSRLVESMKFNEKTKE